MQIMIMIHETHIFDVQFKAGFAIGRDKTLKREETKRKVEQKDEKKGTKKRSEEKEKKRRRGWVGKS